ncbi:hypothetical protein M0208_00955 [Sphingomonas sp. SUN019]|uniref:hypothetical protein n=1 Tax=Sphingomonas sp. SUN019 TaxID=2937788 RepID=UPI002164A321|nr:hypothetical protein [Sphingomonas sp. SUN019]UVO49155.1 hypothetical protein M0208_00955 [Sphingomonas sp. SUN019]
MALPPARERNRLGIRGFHNNPSSAPSAREALLDRVEIRVRAVLDVPYDGMIEAFVDRIAGDGEPEALFGRVQRRGGRWTASVLSGTTISSGGFTLHHRAPEAWLDLVLVINPVRTLSHLLDRFDFDEISDLDAVTFFAANLAPTSAMRSLDGRDNMVTDYRAFAGTVHATYLQRVAKYLRTFEAALATRIVEALCPSSRYEIDGRGGQFTAWNDKVQFRMDWSNLSVSQCEVCWERHDRDALQRVYNLAEGVLKAARTGTIRTHDLGEGCRVEREVGALSVKVPIVSDRIAFGIYAKAVDRLRFEVRYRSGLPDEVRDRLPREGRRLMHWFDAIRDAAAERVPWSALSGLMISPEGGELDALADLLDEVASATNLNRRVRRLILRQLLRHGAISATDAKGDAPSAILKRLVKRGVLEHIRLVTRDPPVGRRYRLAGRYRDLMPS